MKFYKIITNSAYQIKSQSNGILMRYLFDFLNYETLPPSPRHSPMPLEMTWDTFPAIELYPDCKITDSLRGGNDGLGMMLNNKLKQVLSQFNLPPNKSYPFTVKHRGKEYNYYFLHITRLPASTDPVNLDRTVYMKYADMDFKEVEGKYKFKSLSEASESNGRINKHAELWLEKSAYQYDLFNIRPMMTDECQYIISERLRNALVENKITGIEITEAPWIHAVES